MPHAIPPEQDQASSQDDIVLPDAPASSGSAQNEDVDMSDTAKAEAATTSKSLEDMFDDDDDSEDEFSSSAQRPDDSSQPQAPAAAPKAKFSDPETLKQYYGRLCPFRELFQWLNHSATPQPDFQNREFSFWLPENRVIRYLSFPSADLLRKQCVQMAPERFEIGPQYSINPKDRKTLKKASAFKPIMKELVFDIDMTDYDPILMAIKVVDTALREDFGFQHIMWVYSGRRGAHAWISDKRAREMDDSKRKAIANYLYVVKGNENSKRNLFRRPLHPHLERSLRILTPYFTKDVLSEQDPWQSEEGSEKLLALLQDQTLTAALKKKWNSSADRSSMQKWADIDTLAEAGHLSMDTRRLVENKQDIRLEYTYPRLDAEVSKKLNHLLKSPFVIHPGTGRVCVPIDMRRVEDFDPFSVPTVSDLLGEIDQWEKKQGADMSREEKANVKDWQKTSLKPYIEYFKGHAPASRPDSSNVALDESEDSDTEEGEVLRRPPSVSVIGLWAHAAHLDQKSQFLSLVVGVMFSRHGERFASRSLHYQQGRWTDNDLAHALMREYRDMKIDKVGVLQYFINHKRIAFVHILKFRALAHPNYQTGRWRIVARQPIEAIDTEKTRARFMYNIKAKAAKESHLFNARTGTTESTTESTMRATRLAVGLGYGFSVDNDFATGFSIASWLMTAFGFYATKTATDISHICFRPTAFMMRQYLTPRDTNFVDKYWFSGTISNLVELQSCHGLGKLSCFVNFADVWHDNADIGNGGKVAMEWWKWGGVGLATLA
ncbi:hypothetical protein AC579_7261 [Pseudocercospora musae]|uniref:DNA primase n=1 Tax=Pseudocercospora musae TaxID=113226 RepID=A0A139I3F1_9PEZI|nr:hypothetical protein AC579_7261 [Pseudocercospora musae]